MFSLGQLLATPYVLNAVRTAGDDPGVFIGGLASGADLDDAEADQFLEHIHRLRF